MNTKIIALILSIIAISSLSCLFLVQYARNIRITTPQTLNTTPQTLNLRVMSVSYFMNDTLIYGNAVGLSITITVLNNSTYTTKTLIIDNPTIDMSVGFVQTLTPKQQTTLSFDCYSVDWNLTDFIIRGWTP